MSTGAPAPIPSRAARLLMLEAQGLLGRPPRADAAGVAATVERLGFVQVDSINIVARAHHLILGARLAGYQPEQLTALLEQRRLFEHWTHDAAAIPVRWYPHWHHRFADFRRRIQGRRWWKERMGSRPGRILDRVRERVRAEGPLLAQQLAPERRSTKGGGWWSWTREKSALEFLWFSGELAIAGRRNFHKLYDLAERVLPAAVAEPASTADAHVEWACRSALAGLGVATAEEIAGYFDAIDRPTALAWCTGAVARGELVEGSTAGADESPRRAFAPPDWRARAKGLTPGTHMRLICPFDPLLHDRRRALRLFDFDYRFEAFVPAPKRVHGYYVLAVLEGDRLVGRLDPRLDRARAELIVRGPWWEPGVTLGRRRQTALATTLDGFAAAVGAERWTIANPDRQPS